MSLKSKDVLIRPTSDADLKNDVIPGVKSWLDKLEKKYNNQYFAKIFDARTKEMVQVYSEGCKEKYDMTELVIWIENGGNTKAYLI